MNPKKLKPGLVAPYDLLPGNGEGLFGLRHFVNLSLTYLDTYPLTYKAGTHTRLSNTMHAPVHGTCNTVQQSYAKLSTFISPELYGPRQARAELN